MNHCASCLITNLLSIFLLSLPILIILRVIHAYVPAHNSVRIKKEINSQKLNYTRIFLFYTLCQWWMSKSAAKTSLWKKLIRIQTWIQVTIISSRFIDLLNKPKIFFFWNFVSFLLILLKSLFLAGFGDPKHWQKREWI